MSVSTKGVSCSGQEQGEDLGVGLLKVFGRKECASQEDSVGPGWGPGRFFKKCFY